MLKKQSIRICLSVLFLLVLGGAVISCGGQEEIDENSAYVYFINKDDTNLVREVYSFESEDIMDRVQELLDQYEKVPDNGQYQPVKPEELTLLDSYLDAGQLYFNFKREYLELDHIHEVFLRTALVKTFTQINGIDYVGIQIEGASLTDDAGLPVGLMNAGSFAEFTGGEINDYNYTTLTLYFANETGDMLVQEMLNVYYPSSKSLETVVMEGLIGGPKTEGGRPVMPSDIELLGVMITEDVCYINLDENFLVPDYELQERIPVYAIVNSIIDTCEVSAVQISVGGKTDLIFRETIELDTLFERNADVIEQVPEETDAPETESEESTEETKELIDDISVGIEATLEKQDTEGESGDNED